MASRSVNIHQAVWSGMPSVLIRVRRQRLSWTGICYLCLCVHCNCIKAAWASQPCRQADTHRQPHTHTHTLTHTLTHTHTHTHMCTHTPHIHSLSLSLSLSLDLTHTHRLSLS